jgi:hypothetical protein
MVEPDVVQVLRHIVDQVADSATASWSSAAEGVSTLNISPRNSGACLVQVAWSRHEIVIAFGGSSRIELGPADVGLAGEVVRAILAGSVQEWRSLFGSSYDVRLSDGRVLSNAGPLATLQRKAGLSDVRKCAPYMETPD